MIRLNSQVVWTPEINRQLEVTIVLNRDFAERCSQAVLSNQIEFSQQVWHLVVGDKASMPGRFLDFHSGILPVAVHSGRSQLQLKRSSRVSLKGGARSPLRYQVHNEFPYVVDRMWFLRAFGAWVDVAKKVVKWK